MPSGRSKRLIASRTDGSSSTARIELTLGHYNPGLTNGPLASPGGDLDLGARHAERIDVRFTRCFERQGFGVEVRCAHVD